MRLGGAHGSLQQLNKLIMIRCHVLNFVYFNIKYEI